VDELKGLGARGLDWPAPLLDRLRDAVADLRVHGSAHRDDTWPAALAQDESRPTEADEAWIPVRTPAGPGCLAWENSD